MSNESKDQYWGYIRIPKEARGNEELKLSDFQKHGDGEMHYVKQQDKYFGTFNKNRRHGYGIYVFKNGDRYYGEWKNDLVNISFFGIY